MNLVSSKSEPMRWSFSKAGKALDNMDGADPGYGKIMEDTGISWWNVNPIYATSMHVVEAQDPKGQARIFRKKLQIQPKASHKWSY